MKNVINDYEVYTTSESQSLLKLSTSTMKRLLKRGIIRANKVGGQYRILGRELLRLVSPEIEQKATGAYHKIKKDAKKAIRKW